MELGFNISFIKSMNLFYIKLNKYKNYFRIFQNKQIKSKEIFMNRKIFLRKFDEFICFINKDFLINYVIFSNRNNLVALMTSF
jgi:hypothetical protein